MTDDDPISRGGFIGRDDEPDLPALRRDFHNRMDGARRAAAVEHRLGEMVMKYGSYCQQPDPKP